MLAKSVVFDFDGVIHSYTSGFKGADVISDPPVIGIKEAIESIRKQYRVVIVSTRCHQDGGKEAIKKWLDKYGIVVDEVAVHKPPAIVYIDDRAICFDGDPSTLLGKIKSFKTWYQVSKSRHR